MRKVVIVPCSGIGKSYSTVAREVTYRVTEDLRLETTQLVPLSLLVLGDEATRAAVVGAPAITIDGCKLACAMKRMKMVAQSGGTVAQELNRGSSIDQASTHADVRGAASGHNRSQ